RPMSQRLRDTTGEGDRVEARAALLLRSVEPLAESPELKDRVWRAIFRERSRRRRPLAALLARPAMAATLLLATAAAAAAAFGTGWIRGSAQAPSGGSFHGESLALTVKHVEHAADVERAAAPKVVEETVAPEPSSAVVLSTEPSAVASTRPSA